MKPNKRRIDIRLKKSLFERITKISDQLEKTWTDVIEETLTYGLKWYEAKIKREIQTSTNSETPNVQKNNTSPDEDDEEISDEEAKKMIEKLYKK